MHFPCGQESGATFQFMGKMHTFCFMHRVKQKVETFPTPPDTDCVICYEEQEDALEFAFKLESSMEMEIRRSSEINQNPVVCSKVLDTLGQV